MQRLIFNLGMAVLATIAISACSSSTPTAETKPVANTSEAKAETTKTASSGEAKKDDHNHKEGDHGHDGKEANHKHDGNNHQHGEVVDVDGYHLELMTHKEGQANHIDLLLQKGEKHEPVTDAKVTAQIQLPDGSSKSLDLAYKTDEKVYSAEVADLPTGSYKVAVLSEIAGKKVNARFNLKI